MTATGAATCPRDIPAVGRPQPPIKNWRFIIESIPIDGVRPLATDLIAVKKFEMLLIECTVWHPNGEY
jgi:hypothetical protein